MEFKRLWIALASVMTASFIVLGYFGVQLYFHKPPIPARVVTPSGQVLFTEADVRDGQNVWQSMGGRRSAASGAMAPT